MKKFLLWALGIVVGLLVALFAWAQVSPMPAVLVIRYIFAEGDRAAMSALETHIPPGIAEQVNLSYGSRPDEIFDVFYPETAASPLPTIVWVHGGAWVAGSKEGVNNYLRILSGHGYTTVGINYTIAPDATYPTQIGQVVAALEFLTANADQFNIDPGQLVIAGDSAGAQLAAQAANIISSPSYAELMGMDPAIPGGHVKAALLFCGAYSIEGIDLDGDFGWFLRAVLWAYTGVRDFMDDEGVETASVVNYVTPDFPPTFITAGNADPLLPQSLHMAQRLASVGVPVEGIFYPTDHEPALPHEYQFNLDSEDGQMVLDRLLVFLAHRLSE